MSLRRNISFIMLFVILISMFNIISLPKIHATAINANSVGVTHVQGKYNFSATQDFLNEGADAISALGTSVIKLWLVVGNQSINYSFNSTWPTVNNLTELAQTSHYVNVFYQRNSQIL
jgi:hypothetical protein